LVVVKKFTEEITGRKMICTLEEGRKHYDFFSVGCWDVFPFGRPPLEHDTSGEEAVLN
jgi:hypothetical protein